MFTADQIQRTFHEVSDVESLLQSHDFWPQGYSEEGEALYSREAAEFIASVFQELEYARRDRRIAAAAAKLDEAAKKARQRNLNQPPTTRHNFSQMITGQFQQCADALGVPCYVVHQVEVPWPAAPCEAFCAMELTDQMREHLIATGVWSGPKPLICLTSGDLGIFVHEMAHAAVCVEPIAEQPSRLRRKLVALDFAQFVQGHKPDGPPKWQDHDAPFIRAGLHLFRRVVDRGYWWVRLCDVCLSGERYGTSPVTDYADALGSEPGDCASEPLAEVLRRPAPAAFVQLFNNDTQKQEVAA